MGWVVGLLLALSWGSAAHADDPDNCLLCHQFRGLSRLDTETGRVHLYFTDPDYTAHRLGPHARLACTDCHKRDEVTVVPHLPVTRVDCATQCHLSDPGGMQREFSHSNVAGMLARSAHNPKVLEEVNLTGGPVLETGQSSCLYCHDEPLFRNIENIFPAFDELSQRVFDRCDVCHSEKVPADISYYVRHIASRFQHARSALEMAQVCSLCHTDPQVLEEFELPESVASFVRSFHGKAALLGDDSTANCISCHVARGQNAHMMLGKDDPNSAVHAERIADSCRSFECHPGAQKTIAETAVHLDLPTARGTYEFGLAAIFIVLTVLTFGPSAVLVLLDLFHVAVGRGEHHEAGESRRLMARIMQHPDGPTLLKRFTPRQRVEHWLLSGLFITLVLTGFPMKFAGEPWASAMVNLFGGLHIARIVHHWSGIALVVGFLVHMLDVFFDFLKRIRLHVDKGTERPLVRALYSLPMWITPDDLRKTKQLFAYLLFLRSERPTFGRFSPAEKFEYLGVFWGTALLGVTGALLWGEQISSHFLSGRAFNLATIAHTYEAFLALIHVGILHIYNVILAPKVFPLSPATITGHTPSAKLEEEHGEMIEDVARHLGLSTEGD